MNKICSKCSIEKSVDSFFKDKSKRDGLSSSCKTCISETIKNYYINNREYKLKQAKERYQKNPDKNKERSRLWYHNNKERVKNRCKNYYIENPDKKKESNIKYRTKNKDKILAQKRIYEKHKRATDINYKIKRYLRTRIYNAIKNNYKSDTTLKLLGCSIDELKQHLESHFTQGMAWNNYGYNGWHIDHIIPCDYFNLSKEDEQKKCFHYTNLQPLWCQDNLSKGNKLPCLTI